MATASLTHNYIAGTLAKASEVNQNFTDLVGFINTEAIHRDASIAFTGIPSGPASDPTTSNQFARKEYVDRLGVLSQDRRTSNSANVAPGGTFDFITSPTLIVGRWYSVHVHSRYQVLSAGNYTIELYRAGVKVAELEHLFNAAVSQDGTIDSQYIFTEAAGGTFAYQVKVSAGSSGQVGMLATAVNPRTLTIWDLGP